MAHAKFFAQKQTNTATEFCQALFLAGFIFSKKLNKIKQLLK